MISFFFWVRVCKVSYQRQFHTRLLIINADVPTTIGVDVFQKENPVNIIHKAYRGFDLNAAR